MNVPCGHLILQIQLLRWNGGEDHGLLGSSLGLHLVEVGVFWVSYIMSLNISFVICETGIGLLSELCTVYVVMCLVQNKLLVND